MIYLIGNKLDLINSGEGTRAISQNEIAKYCSENRLRYMETSAKSDVNIRDAFYNLLEGKNILSMFIFFN